MSRTAISRIRSGNDGTIAHLQHSDVNEFASRQHLTPMGAASPRIGALTQQANKAKCGSSSAFCPRLYIVLSRLNPQNPAGFAGENFIFQKSCWRNGSAPDFYYEIWRCTFISSHALPNNILIRTNSVGSSPT
jgi:hypothetical protein